MYENWLVNHSSPEAIVDMTENNIIIELLTYTFG